MQKQREPGDKRIDKIAARAETAPTTDTERGCCNHALGKHRLLPAMKRATNDDDASSVWRRLACLTRSERTRVDLHLLRIRAPAGLEGGTGWRRGALDLHVTYHVI